MESHDFNDNIKAEKANALSRYQMFTNITKLFQITEVFVAVALISWSSTRLPLVLKFSSEYVSAFSSINQHVVFLVGNVIVIVCYVLSRYPDSGNQSGNSGTHHDEGRESTFDAPDLTHPKSTELHIPIIINERPVVKSESKLTAETEIKPTAKQTERFRRTESDARIPVKKPGRELRRSVTETRRSGGGEDRTFEAVEKLSNEEFRIAVEAFISRQQRLLKKQSMVEEDYS